MKDKKILARRKSQLDILAKIIDRHEWDRERSLMEGNFTLASIFAIKKEAVESALNELKTASLI